MIPLMNHMVRVYLRHWDKELQDISYNCALVQKQQLEEVLDSVFTSQLHQSVRPLAYSNFKRAFPITNYESVKEGILKIKDEGRIKCKYYAQSAGTTSGEKKLIPTPEAYVKKNHLRGSWYILHTLYQHSRDMSVFKAKNLLVGGSLYEDHGDYIIGDVSGIMINRIPSFFRPWYVPDIKTAVSADWESKIEITARQAAEESGIALLGGIPTWVLSVCQRILTYSGVDTLSDLWPNLQAYIHGGVSFDPYLAQFKSLISSPSFRYIEVYNATEGFFAFQDRPGLPGMLLMCASGVFFEFIEYEDFVKEMYTNAIEISQVELNKEYVMIISTITGLLRYVQGDIVRFVSIAPYRIIVTGRINEYINAFGEDLMLYHVEEALLKVNKYYAVTIKNYSIAPHYLSISEKGWHDWYIEFGDEPNDLTKYAQALDQEIIQLNPNYAQKRAKNLALNPLQIHQLHEGCIDQYFRKFGSIGGQSKLQKLRNDRVIAQRIESLIGHRHHE